MTVHPAETAIPDGQDVSKSLLRGLFTGRIAIRVEDADELRAMDTGGANLFYVGAGLWSYDPADTTSPDDGSTVIVSNDGNRYKPGASANVSANYVLAGPTSGSPAPATPRLLTSSDIPFTGTRPGGRLTITTDTPVITSNTTGAGTVYYTPYQGNIVTLYDGTDFRVSVFSEISNVLSASSTGKAGPASVVNNSNYDLFVWSDSGTIRLTRGPVWTSDTGRGTGVGTTQLVKVGGVYLNAANITNGPNSQRGTYVGTIRTNGSATVDVNFGATAASGGSAGFLGLWNAFNRVPVNVYALDSADSWTYSTQAFRSYNNSTSNRVSIIRGLDETAISADFVGAVSVSSGSIFVGAAIGLDSTSAANGIYLREFGQNGLFARRAIYRSPPGLGFHFLQALEFGGANTTFFGDGGGVGQTGLSVFTDW